MFLTQSLHLVCDLLHTFRLLNLQEDSDDSADNPKENKVAGDNNKSTVEEEKKTDV